VTAGLPAVDVVEHDVRHDAQRQRDGPREDGDPPDPRVGGVAQFLGLTHTPEELRKETPHRTVGQLAAGSWILSLSLGVVTYVLLNWVYGYEFTRGTGMG
jgi:hypothetical protein